MKSSEKVVFTQWLVGLGMVYGKPIHEVVIEIYWQALQAFEWDEIKKAFHAHVTHSDQGQYMPKPTDVVQYLRGSSGNQAMKAWSKVAKAISQIGAYSSVVFDDATIHAVVTEMGGWISLCHCKLEELPFRAREFEKRYAAYVLHPPKEYPAQLVGIAEQQQRAYGMTHERPELFGDRDKARQVFEQGVGQSSILSPTNVLEKNDD